MMNDADAQQENEARAIEREELRKRGLWQRPKPVLLPQKDASAYRRRYWTQEEADRCS